MKVSSIFGSNGGLRPAQRSITHWNGMESHAKPSLDRGLRGVAEAVKHVRAGGTRARPRGARLSTGNQCARWWYPWAASRAWHAICARARVHRQPSWRADPSWSPRSSTTARCRSGSRAATRRWPAQPSENNRLRIRDSRLALSWPVLRLPQRPGTWWNGFSAYRRRKSV